MKRIGILFYVVCLISQISVGQTTDYSKRPFWTDGYFKELSHSYIEVVSAFDYDLDGAKNKAANEIVKRRSLATGSESNVSISDAELKITSEHNVIVKARIIDEFEEHTTGGYNVYLLVQTAKNPTFSYESVSFSDDYKVSGKAFVPGMAQLYKGSKIKGYSIISAQVLSIASIILCENQRSSYQKKAIEQPKFAREYGDKASNWETGRNISIGIAAGIYVYNIIDAFVAKGKKRIIVNSKDTSFRFSPQISQNSASLAVVYNF